MTRERINILSAILNHPKVEQFDNQHHDKKYKKLVKYLNKTFERSERSIAKKQVQLEHFNPEEALPNVRCLFLPPQEEEELTKKERKKLRKKAEKQNPSSKVDAPCAKQVLSKTRMTSSQPSEEWIAECVTKLCDEGDKLFAFAKAKVAKVHKQSSYKLALDFLDETKETSISAMEQYLSDAVESQSISSDQSHQILQIATNQYNSLPTIILNLIMAPMYEMNEKAAKENRKPTQDEENNAANRQIELLENTKIDPDEAKIAIIGKVFQEVDDLASWIEQSQSHPVQGSSNTKSKNKS